MKKKLLTVMLAGMLCAASIVSPMAEELVSVDLELTAEEPEELIQEALEEAVSEEIPDGTVLPEDLLDSGAEVVDAEALTAEEEENLLDDGEVFQTIVPEVGEKITTAGSGTCGNSVTWSYANGTLTISGSGAMFDYDIDTENYEDGNEYEYVDATKQPDYYDYDIKNVVINSGVTKIGEGAFFNQTGLTSIIISSTVTSIGEGAFINCTALTSVTIPSGVTVIGESIFAGCTTLSQVSLPSSLQTIPRWAFENCDSLTSVTIPDGVTTIEEGAFVSCLNLKTISIPSTVATINDYAFSDCRSLTSITIPGGVKVLSDEVFSGCVSLTSVNLSSGLTTIGEGAFNECEALTSIDLPSTVTTIYDTAFSSCYGLTSIKLPSSLSFLGGMVFQDCQNLTEIEFTGNAPQFDTVTFGGISGVVDGLIVNAYYPCHNTTWTAAVMQNYGGTVTWEKTGHQWDSGVTEPGEKPGYPEVQVYTCTLCGDVRREADPVPLYRLYNPESQEHLFTTDKNERRVQIGNGWNDEGIAWYVPGNGEGYAVYRVFNPQTGEHHYTSDTNEVRVLTTLSGWNNEGMCWRSDPSEGVPVYRIFNPNTSIALASHHLTKDANERRVQLANGWRAEGITCYGVKVD